MDGYSIYPKQFRNAKIPIEKNRCFVLMPFKSEFDIVYGNIKKELNDNGYVCHRADEISGSTPIMNNILNEILKSHFIIADLTIQNPNVFYELGIAHTFKDAQNIILVTQKLEYIPFDLRHINNIIYDPNNLKYLTANILRILNDNHYFFGFSEALQHRNIINVIHDNQEEFVDYLKNSLGSLLSTATDVLTEQLIELEERKIERYFDALITSVDALCKDGNYYFLRGTMKVLFESLVTCARYKVTDKITYDFLYGNLLSGYGIAHEELVSYQIDLATTLAGRGAKLTTVMNWIINYFSVTKSASIDLNRYKVERFLMVTNDQTINNMIVDALFHENCYIREHLADIAGEKKIQEAGQTLLKQLVVEENYFTAVSIISAIGKLEVMEGPKAILKWLVDNQENIIKTNQLFVLKHAYIALSRLDKRYGTADSLDFETKYGEHIKNYFIL